MKTSNQTYVDKEVDLHKGQAWILGPKLFFERCSIAIEVGGRSLTLNRVSFNSCTIHARVKLKNVDCTWAKFQECALKGTFVGCDFGYRPKPDFSGFGKVVSCDFSNAVLHSCRFFAADMADLSLPRWPCFTLLHKQKAHKRLESIDLPGKMAIPLLADPLPGQVASCYNATMLVKDFDSSEKELRELLQGKPYVLM